MRRDQCQAFEHAVGDGGLKIIEGRAGTGKSYALQAVREAHERAGRRVIGLAPTNAVAQDLKAEGFTEATTALARFDEAETLANEHGGVARRVAMTPDAQQPPAAEAAE